MTPRLAPHHSGKETSMTASMSRAFGATGDPRASGATGDPRASGATSTAPPDSAPRASGATLQDIIALARAFAAAREATEALADDIKAIQRKALRSRLRTLRSRVAEQAAAEDALRAAIQARPELFVRPRTVAVDGIRFGLRKQPGAVALGDEAQAIRRLRAIFPGQAPTLIRVSESLDRKALRRLSAAELAQIGITIERARDEVTIATASSDLDRIVAALLDDAAPAEAA